MGKRFRRFLAIGVLATVSGVGACGGDSKASGDTAGKAAAAGPVSAEDFRKQQQHYADSLINATRTAKDVVDKLGQGYAVGSIKLRDSLALLTEKSNCYFQGRQTDPYLAGTVSWFVFMSIVGSNIVRVQQGDWTSEAGNIVTSCLNLAAKDWKFDASFGKQGAYITQVQLKPEVVKKAEKPD